jgi:hypothetical protein
MATEQIGYRRLYRSRGCRLQGRESFVATFPIGEVQVQLYIGPKPTLGVWVRSGDKYIVPGEQVTVVKGNYNKDASELPEAGRFFTEIRCSRPIEIADDLRAKFHDRDLAAQASLVAVAEKGRGPLAEIADLVAGTVGLRFHRQLVLELVDENAYVERGPDDTPINLHSAAMELLDSLSVREEGLQQMEALLTAIGQAPPAAIERAAVVMRWLVFAWEERNTVAKFLSLFVPLEFILGGVEEEPAEREMRTAQQKKLQELIQQHAGADGPALLEHLSLLARGFRLSLNDRFAVFARAAALPACEADIAAFRQFNKMRNSLVHRGSKDVRLILGHDEAVTEARQGLEDLAERYVCWNLFGDVAVYRSRWRPAQPSQGGTPHHGTPGTQP